MALVVKEFSFHAGHRLKNHLGKCRNLHGHTYRVQVGVEGFITHGSKLPDDGMVLDFDEIKKAWESLVINLDHRFLMEITDPLYPLISAEVVAWPGPPTAESIATYLFESFLQLISYPPAYAVKFVRVWETPTSYAEVSG